jgi:hypothetical protein
VGNGALVVRAAPTVIHERLDDEVIAIDLERGIYYAMVGPAADVWTSFERPATVDAVAQSLAQRYRATSADVHTDVAEFTSRLQAAGLLVAVPVDGAAEPGAVDDAPRQRWTVPELEAYDDMADLVLLDPIHQVDESGWPHLPDPGP